jgi:DNA repair photolyase
MLVSRNSVTSMEAKPMSRSVPDSEPQPDGLSRVIEKERRRGRGTRSNVTGRFEAYSRERFEDGWESLADLPPFKTQVHTDATRSVICRNDSPDISFDRSINPYRGCEHGCTYCYARPTHCYLGHSAGLDFETQLYAKPEADRLLRAELAKQSYRPATISLGTNTDPYQPVERRLGITRRILEVLEEARHPVGIVTKSALVIRDIDILSRMAALGLAKVALSVTTLDARLARSMEPRASAPHKRLEALRRLSEADIPTSVMVAPVIPALNDHEIERILEAARGVGAQEAGYVMLRLPLEIKDLFREWLATDHPDRAKRVIKLVQSLHAERDYTAEFGLRQRGSGPYAKLVAKRFEMALRRLGLNERRQALRTDLFRRPAAEGGQMSLL